MNQRVWTYLAQLTRALQMEGVDGQRAGEFVAEIDSHLTETNADPVEEFGTPFELATQLASRPGSRRPGWVPPTWALWIVGLLVALVLVALADLVMLGWDGDGVPLRARGIAWIGVFYPATMAFSYAATRRLSGRAWTALTGGRALLVVLAIGAITATVERVAGDRIVARIPATAFWTALAVAVPVILVVAIKGRNPIRFPAHAAHLRPLKRGLLAGSPPEAPARGSASV